MGDTLVLLTLIVALVGIITQIVLHNDKIRREKEKDKLNMEVKLDSGIMNFNEFPELKQRQVWLNVKNICRHLIVLDRCEIRIDDHPPLKCNPPHDSKYFVTRVGSGGTRIPGFQPGFQSSTTIKEFPKYIDDNKLTGDIIAQAFVFDIEGNEFKSEKVIIPTNDIPSPEEAKF